MKKKILLGLGTVIIALLFSINISVLSDSNGNSLLLNLTNKIPEAQASVVPACSSTGYYFPTCARSCDVEICYDGNGQACGESNACCSGDYSCTTHTCNKGGPV